MRWRDARAGLIAFAIFLGLVEGCPIPPPHEVEPWQESYVSIIRPVQRTIMKPFAWLPKGLRVTERFALFQAAEPDRFRFEIRGKTADGADRLLFRAGDDSTEYAALLTPRRVRGAWNPTDRPTSQYTPFARWFARIAFSEHAELTAIWFRFEKIHIEGGIPRGTGVFAWDHYQYRGKP